MWYYDGCYWNKASKGILWVCCGYKHESSVNRGGDFINMFMNMVSPIISGIRYVSMGFLNGVYIQPRIIIDDNPLTFGNINDVLAMALIKAHQSSGMYCWFTHKTAMF